MVLVRLAIRCTLIALLSDSLLDGTARPEHHPNNDLATVRQAHVDPHTIVLPVVDGNGMSFRRLSTEDGLSQTRVTQILQDDQGFIWFGTESGLRRYDGYRFREF